LEKYRVDRANLNPTNFSTNYNKFKNHNNINNETVQLRNSFLNKMKQVNLVKPIKKKFVRKNFIEQSLNFSDYYNPIRLRNNYLILNRFKNKKFCNGLKLVTDDLSYFKAVLKPIDFN